MQLRFALLLLIICFKACLNSPLICTNGFTLLNKKCLKLFDTKVNHTSAESSCNSFGATLVTVKNVNDEQAIATVVAASSARLIWLGLYCFDSDPAKCLWDDNSGSAQSYDNFSIDFPLVDAGHCVYLSTLGALAGKWISEDCESKLMSYICELPTTHADDCTYNYNGYCYTFSSTAEPFIIAQTKCAETYGDLVSIHSSNENRYIETFAAQDYYLIGAVWKLDNSLYWLDKSKWDYNNTDPENSYRGDYCVAMSTVISSPIPSGFWFSTNCTRPAKYICKRPAGVQSTTASPVTVAPSPANPSNCNAGLLMSPGVITSPNYPENYFNNENCTYQLSTLGAYKIALRFASFSTEANDVVTVYDGLTTDSPCLRRCSGTQRPFALTSSGNTMLVTFTSDSKGISSGFYARFSSIVYRR
ncbi:CUB domain-containing protein [Caenorhabditis elegans]|uniref:CUB domain-containing protein n=1 Tax=Caenorhabditis elegans TaxID=6239 RepID=O17741_CAEEL|nr:CUB domain-containing protein [Caenorhabditis elegans]CAB04034.1 CUB domain-containing protein [Caenorhabditis elegans]|eukprot:NP_493152.1 C-type LECtin [Caenorhabditis elegans]